MESFQAIPVYTGKKASFTDHEKRILIDLINKRRWILECRKNDGTTLRKKNQAWDHVTAEYNNQPFVTARDSKQLKKCWDNMKTRTKKLYAVELEALTQNTMAPDGIEKNLGTNLSSNDPIGRRVLEILSTPLDQSSEQQNEENDLLDPLQVQPETAISTATDVPVAMATCFPTMFDTSQSPYSKIKIEPNGNDLFMDYTSDSLQNDPIIDEIHALPIYSDDQLHRVKYGHMNKAIPEASVISGFNSQRSPKKSYRGLIKRSIDVPSSTSYPINQPFMRQQSEQYHLRKNKKNFCTQTQSKHVYNFQRHELHEMQVMKMRKEMKYARREHKQRMRLMYLEEMALQKKIHEK